MDYVKLIGTSTFDEISKELSRLTEDTNPESIDDLSLFLTIRSGDTYGKQEIPRLACRALIQKGPSGINKLLSILNEIDGYIYPLAIINSIWYASNGALDPFHFCLMPIYSPLNNEPTALTIIAAKDAFHEIVIGSLTERAKSDAFISFLHNQAFFSKDNSQLMRSIVNDIADSSIKISKKMIEEFEELISRDEKEENYQLFLESNPVFLNPLASEVLNKKRLGDDLITDFVIKTFDNRYILVEIEKPQDRLFNAKSDFSSNLVHAYGQVLDFVAWVDNNVAYAKTKMDSISSPTGLVIIGRRSDLTPQQESKLQCFNSNNQRIQVITYDDVLSNARILYNNIRRH